MRKNQQVLKLFIVLFLCTAYIFSFSHYGAKAFDTLFAGEEGYQPGTMIGSVNLEGKSSTEALALLKTSIQEWQNSTTYKLAYKEKTIDLEIDPFEFAPEETVSSLVDGRQNGIHVTLDETILVEWIKQISPQLIGIEINLKDLNAKLVEPASTLTAGEVVVKLSDFIVDSNKKPEVIATGTVKVKEASDEIEMALDGFPDIKIEALSDFSFQGFIEQQKIEGLSTSTLSMMASAAYIAVLQTNFDIVERNIGKELPDFAELGSEARIEPELGLDFSFRNPNDAEFGLKFEYAGGKLTATIIGTPFLYEYKVVADGEDVFKPKTIIQFSPLLKPGQTNVKEEGKEGKIIKVYREVYSNGTLIDIEAISDDFYPPIHRIEVKPLSASQTTPTSETPGTNTEAPVSEPGTVAPAGGNTEPVVTDPSTVPSEAGTGNVDNGNVKNPGKDDGGLWGKPNEQPK
ncbi:hypothetical protein A8F94_05235 [Bacillus sp. FJAT-27225]|uniref:G5 domain-containing protein n=1 Tax=Bacillus sp. FJAT-27225 TaxID=1743144 RepID=UPI00080C3003|nr:G5 domain-containing protein [Bacillus sp. FJAT-27225]OCA91265.1 hypothetical protein A8F94_05235 [Bacillus sp. FJAT-27225]